VGGTHAFTVDALPTIDDAIARYAERSGRDVSHIGWYHVFSRWKLAIVLEGSFAKWQRGESNKAVHEFFGPQADRLLASASALVDGAGGAR
jgi:aminoglycoside phosphotransferase (APT) family kinase protein